MESSLPKPDRALRGDVQQASPAGVDAERQVDGGEWADNRASGGPDESHGRRSEMIRADQGR